MAKQKNDSGKGKEGKGAASSSKGLLKASRKVLLAAIGAAALAQDEIEDFVNRLVARGEIAEKDGKGLLREVLEKRKARMEGVEHEFHQHFQAMLERLNVPTRKDVEDLSAKVEALSKKLDEEKKSEE
jgi:polyhydroxyalkanoate synthesis regulator phasin